MKFNEDLKMEVNELCDIGMMLCQNSSKKSKSRVMFRSGPTNLSKVTQPEFNKFLESFELVVTDCDGVLWRNINPIPGSVETINRLCAVDKQVVFFSNNSTKTRDDFVHKASRMDYVICRSRVITTSYLIVNYLKDIDFHKKVYLIGSRGLASELDEAGIQHIGMGPDHTNGSLIDVIEDYQVDMDVGAVIVGFDEHFSYKKMLNAASYLNQKQCLFMATNNDDKFHFTPNLVLPGTGSILKAVEACAGREAQIIGKPNSYILEYLLREYKVDPKRTLLIGDNLEMDVAMGIKCGFQTLLVLSGITKPDEVFKMTKRRRDTKLNIPDYFLPTLGDMLPFLTNLPKQTTN